MIELGGKIWPRNSANQIARPIFHLPNCFDDLGKAAAAHCGDVV